MTIVTTSRKPAPELRSLAKDFAFAAKLRYVIRGKMGLGEVRSIDPRIILFSHDAGLFQVQITEDGQPAAWFHVTGVKAGNRERTRESGIAVTDQSVYEQLRPYVEVKLSEGAPGQCIFDGTRTRRYQLKVVSHGP